MGRARDIALGLAISCATFAAIGALAALRLDRWRSGLAYYEGIRKPEFGRLHFPGLTQDDAVQLGWAHLEGRRPPSSYTLAAEAKPPGVTRIGVFGCSFVYGSEAPDGGDFPTLLADRIARRGIERAQVVNFGVGGYGMHQAFAMYERVARRYALDVAIFNFYSFHRGRDETFVADASSYGPVHARYIAPGGVPQLVEVPGADRSEAAAIYAAAVPRWRYLRYDARPPAIVRALLPAGRTLANPFYADPDADAIYAALIERTADDGVAVIVACNDEGACPFADRIGDPRVLLVDMVAPQVAQRAPALYRAPEAHLTALGNELVARELFALLRGAARLRAPLIEPGAALPLEAAARDAAAAPLARGAIAIGERQVAVLVERDPGVAAFAFAPADLSGRGVRALLHVPGGAELRFAPLHAPPSDDDRVEIAFRLGGEAVRATVGGVEQAGGVARIRETGLNGDGWQLDAPLVNAAGELAIRAARPVRDVEIAIGGRPVLRADGPAAVVAGRQRFRVAPVDGDWLLARGQTERAWGADAFAKAGTLDLVLTPEDGRALRQPLVGYRKRVRTLRAFPRAAGGERFAPLARGRRESGAP